MAQWGNIDNANNSPSWGPDIIKKKSNTANRNAMFGNTTGSGIFAVDDKEAQASPHIAHAGWVKRTVGTGGRAGRVQFETLVAMSSMTGDSEDVATPDASFKITTQPASKNVATSTATTLTMNYTVRPANTASVIAWQANTGTGFVSLVNDATYSNVATNTLSISSTTGLNGVQYRALLTATGANAANTKSATLTVA